MARVTSIEAVAVVPADPSAVWSALLDQDRWRHWDAVASRAHLDGVEPLDPTFARVGDRRRCSAQLTGLPLVGRRRLTWEELVTDVDQERTLELEAAASRASVRRWRVRFWLLAQADGETRVRCHVTYRPATLGGWLADRLVLRTRVAEAAGAWLHSLAASFQTAAAPVEAHAAPELVASQPSPVDAFPDPGPVAA